MRRKLALTPALFCFLYITALYCQDPEITYELLRCPSNVTVSLDRNGEFDLADLDPGLFVQEKNIRYLSWAKLVKYTLEGDASFMYFQTAGARGGSGEGIAGQGASLAGYQDVRGESAITAIIANTGVESINPNGSGGGGTFVSVGGNGNSDFTPTKTLIVAGGGGGGGKNGSNSNCTNKDGENSTILISQAELGAGGASGTGGGTLSGGIFPGKGGGGLTMNGGTAEDLGGRAAINGGEGHNGTVSYGGGGQSSGSGGGGGGATGGNGGNGVVAYNDIEDCFGEAGTSYWKGQEPVIQGLNNFAGLLTMREITTPNVSFNIQKLDCSDAGGVRTIQATSATDNTSCSFNVSVIGNYTMTCPTSRTVDLDEFGNGSLSESIINDIKLNYTQTFNPGDGYQMINIPAEAENLQITLAGGSGGGSGDYGGGAGARFSSTVQVSQAMNLHILAGAQGSSGTYAGGGGGASYVATGEGGWEAFNPSGILMIAGGGGGTNFNPSSSGGSSDVITFDLSQAIGGQSTIGDIGEGGGGAGLLSSGQSPVNQICGGTVPVRGAQGGQPFNVGHVGGFGGGGAGSSYGGGGAGAQGGDAGSPGLSSTAGTSYNQGGTISNLQPHSGNGFVTISYDLPINTVASQTSFDCSDDGQSITVNVSTLNYGKYNCSFDVNVTSNTALSCPSTRVLILDENDSATLKDLGDSKYIPYVRETISAADFNFGFTDGVRLIPYTIPAGITEFTIEAAGARGGSAGLPSSQNNGGAGAKFTSTFSTDGNGLTLQIIVGHEGKRGTNANPDADNADGIVIESGGGGGATWIGQGTNANTIQYFNRSNILMVAGGGGGGNGDEGNLLSGEASFVIEPDSEFTGSVESSAILNVTGNNAYGGGGGGSLLRRGGRGYRTGGHAAVSGAFGGGDTGFFDGYTDGGTGGFGGGGGFGLDAGGGGGGGATGGDGGRGAATGITAYSAKGGSSYTRGTVDSGVEANNGDGYVIISYGNVFLSQTDFNCDDLTSPQVVTLSTPQECTGTCQFQVNVRTDLQMVCKQDTTVVLDENDMAILDPEDLILQTTQGCLEIDTIATILNFDASDISASPILFQNIVTIEDASGAVSYCDANVTVERAENVPLELLSFEAEKADDVNILNWETSNEVNVSHMEIERSIISAFQWHQIGSMNATGSPYSNTSYSFRDRSPGDTGYYRLKIVDFDGSFEYSKIVVVRRAAGATKIYPSIANDFINVDPISDHKELYAISLITLNGQVVRVWEVEGQKKNTLNLADVQSGTYFVVVNKGTRFIRSQKIVVQKI